MKIGPRTYNEQETAIIEVYKKHIQWLHEQADDHWMQLINQLKIDITEPNAEFDHLWDYVINDFKIEK